MHVYFVSILFLSWIENGLKTGQHGMETDSRVDNHIPQSRWYLSRNKLYHLIVKILCQNSNNYELLIYTWDILFKCRFDSRRMVSRQHSSTDPTPFHCTRTLLKRLRDESNLCPLWKNTDKANIFSSYTWAQLSTSFPYSIFPLPLSPSLSLSPSPSLALSPSLLWQYIN